MAETTDRNGLFPYPARQTQGLVIESVRKVAGSGGTLLMDAPTGSGKTVAVLAPVLEHALSSKHKVLYLTRTHSQATQVISETRAISKHSGKAILAVTLEGRDGRCPLMDDMEELRSANAEEYGKLCSDRKRATENSLSSKSTHRARLEEGATITVDDLDGCPYYAALLSRGTADPASHIAKSVPTGSEFTEWAKNEGMCPYELAKALCRDANLVVAPYVMFFHPKIRESLLNWLGVPMGSLDLILDEAHNLPEYLRELSSFHLLEETVMRAIREVESAGNIPVIGDLRARQLLEMVQETVAGLADEMTTEEEEGLLPEGMLEERLLGGEVATSHRLEQALVTLAMWGDELRETKRKKRLLPRSYAYNVATFLLAWRTLQPPAHVKVVVREPARSLIVYALDAVTSAAPVRETHLSVHMSGTLSPLSEYREALGLPEASVLLTVPPSFPLENRRLFYSEKATTRFVDISKEGVMEGLKDEVARVVRTLPVKTAVFFPSFALLERMIKDGLKDDIGRETVVESQGLSTTDLWHLVDGFKFSPNAGVIMGVCGGRIAEGIDFPQEQLGAVVIVGIPYPRPTARREALRRYMDVALGHGWEHCYAAPARRAILQALGRMIRSETDRGIGVILDQRAMRFADSLPGLEMTDALETCARTFYGGVPTHSDAGGKPQP
jgi:DNA excision repair protein ERCC-2